MKGMLALVAAVLLTESSPLPRPFLVGRPSPIVPIAPLSERAPVAVARGNYWRPGGYARLTYYYRFEPGVGPSLEEVVERGGFQVFRASFGPDPGNRAVRDRNGVRQVVIATKLRRGENWKWGGVKGPADVVVVTEMPLDLPLPKHWPRLPELTEAPLPPGFPTPYRFLSNKPLFGVRSDPIIPRFPRSELNVWVILAVQPDVDTLEKTADEEMHPGRWKKVRRGRHLRYEDKLNRYGLVAVETVNDQPDPTRLLVQLKYRYQDRENSPRLQ